jgi:coenzyme F420-dependent glucose-6-phosphate dehydrogenase
MPRYWFSASTEEFTPSQMLEQARAAEAAGFDGLGVSDHFAPWWPAGQASQAWVWLGALGQVSTLPMGTAVTPVLHHYHPALVAQAWMSLEELYPGRVWLGAGSGEALNERPLGLDPWPEPREKVERLERGLEAITRLWDGETVTMDGGWFRLEEARLYTRAATRPKLYVSAFGPRAAAVAGRYGDGLWTMGDKDTAGPLIEAYRESCSRHGREAGEVILQTGFHLAPGGLASARKWKATALGKPVFLGDLADPAEMAARAAEEVSDETFADAWILSEDPDDHVERIREIAEVEGVTVINLQLVGDADPLGSISRYGERVLPALRA